jgi:hypothetical protein
MTTFFHLILCVAAGAVMTAGIALGIFVTLMLAAVAERAYRS